MQWHWWQWVGSFQYFDHSGVILAAGGVKVAKFGNRSARSSSGSFDFLEALGIPISIPKDAVHDLLDETGVVFLFAPNYYPTLGKLAAIRRSLPKSSIFNAIGPLLHPFNPTKRLMGTSDPTVYKLAGQYLRSDRFTETAIIVRAESGLDEFDPTSRSRYVEVNAAVAADEKTIEPSRLPAPHAVAMTAVNNHDIFHQLLSGEGDDYYRDLVCLNAGAGFKIDGKVSSIEDGMILARELLNSGAVADKFARCRRAYAKFTD